VFYSTSAIASTYAATVHGWFDGTLGTWDINALAIALSGSNVASLLTVSGNTAQNICDEDDGGGSHSFSFVHGMVVGGCTAVIVVGIVAVTVAAATAMPLVAIMHKQTDRQTDRQTGRHTHTHTHTQADVVTAVQASDANSAVVHTLIGNSLHSGWAPSLDSSIRLCHGDADTVVSPAGAAAAAASLPNASLVAMGSGVCSSHSDCGYPCFIDSLDQLAQFVGRSDPRPAAAAAPQATTCSGGCRRGNRPM
jgi:hypothetical protein